MTVSAASHGRGYRRRCVDARDYQDRERFRRSREDGEPEAEEEVLSAGGTIE